MKKIDKLPSSSITPESVFRMERRDVMKSLGIGIASLMVMSDAKASLFSLLSDSDEDMASPKTLLPLKFSQPDAYQTSLPLTPEDKVTGYNNFYEFGLDKSDPAKYAHTLKTDEWTLTVEGEVNNPLTLNLDDILHQFALEERIYRMRCVEAWSMVIPWVGFSLSSLISMAKPTSRAKYVAFETVYNPEQMRGQKNSYIGGGIPYPYVEGLRLDEAMNPLTLMATGVYGKTLPNQNGAPIRLVVPWKYGFKSIKSVKRIRLMESMPPTTWNLLAANEYGFYANVNPSVNHPRWSQATERFIGSGGLLNVTRQPTLLFNGYGEEVASLYRDLDLRVNF